MCSLFAAFVCWILSPYWNPVVLSTIIKQRAPSWREKLPLKSKHLTVLLKYERAIGYETTGFWKLLSMFVCQSDVTEQTGLVLVLSFARYQISLPSWITALLGLFCRLSWIFKVISRRSMARHRELCSPWQKTGKRAKLRKTLRFSTWHLHKRHRISFEIAPSRTRGTNTRDSVYTFFTLKRFNWHAVCLKLYIVLLWWRSHH